MARTRLTWGLLAVAAGLGLAAGGCSAFGRAESAPTVLVDYSHDAFATQFIAYFPDEVTVHPGGSVVFEQHWTGEPHTVTFGTLVDEALSITRPLIEEYGHIPEHELPDWVIPTYVEAMSTLPGEQGPPPPPEDAEPADESLEAEGRTAAEGEAGEDLNFMELDQAMAQPCVVGADEDLPEDGLPCETRELAPFTGTEQWYNSGIIPYEGPGGNRFELQLDESIEPGSYFFFCAVHGAFQSGVVEVVPEDVEIPSPRDASVELRNSINDRISPYLGLFSRAQEEDYSFAGERHTWNYAGLLPENAVNNPGTGIINEFVPREITAKVDEPVTWRIFGPHSISFNVPEYFPIVDFDDDGTVKYNDSVWAPAGGAPEPPPYDEIDPEEPLVLDGGTFDGSGFWSSGVLGHDKYVEYTLRVATPGTYRFACLIHPPMVGTLRVTEE